MKLRRRLRQLLERVANVPTNRPLPRGVDVAHDIARAFPRYRVDVVLDVGANVGQSARRYLGCFPGAQIYCFEPVRDTFRRLQDSLEGERHVHCVPLALGSRPGKGEMALTGTSDMFFLLGQQAHAGANVVTEPVDIVTLDEFCASSRIERVSYLKIDTEGGDLEVLRGGDGMLKGQRIDLVEVEAGMNAGNQRHVPFEALKGYLEARDYLLFAIYEQMHEWITGEPHLRRTNPVFVSRRMIAGSTQGAGAGSSTS